MLDEFDLLRGLLVPHRGHFSRNGALCSHRRHVLATVVLVSAPSHQFPSEVVLLAQAHFLYTIASPTYLYGAASFHSLEMEILFL